MVDSCAVYFVHLKCAKSKMKHFGIQMHRQVSSLSNYGSLSVYVFEVHFLLCSSARRHQRPFQYLSFWATEGKHVDLICTPCCLICISIRSGSESIAWKKGLKTPKAPHRSIDRETRPKVAGALQALLSEMSIVLAKQTTKSYEKRRPMSFGCLNCLRGPNMGGDGHHVVLNCLV